MYIMYSELFKKIFFKLSVIFRKLSSGNFEFKHVYYDDAIKCLMVKFVHQHTEIVERLQDFENTYYFNLLSRDDLKKIIKAI